MEQSVMAGRRFSPAVFVTVMCLLVMAASAAAQTVEFSSSLNPVGSGARATAMGGAFIAVADDATAASWNPAGLVQLEKPEFSLVASGIGRSETYNAVVHPEINTTNRMSTEGLNYASFVYPFLICDQGKTSCRNAVFSLNYQRLYEMDKKVNIRFNMDLTPPDFMPLDAQMEQDGYLYALSPALALQVTPSFYVGATINLWNDALGKNGWEQKSRVTGSGTFFGSSYVLDATTIKQVQFSGSNMNLGFLWNATPSFTVGGVYKTGFDADLKTTTVIEENSIYGGTPSSTPSLAYSSQSMKMPMSYGIGTQYKFSQSFLVSFDAYRTQWSRFSLRDSSGVESNPVTGKTIAEQKLKDTTQFRLGTEYVIMGKAWAIPVRAGVFLDPQPGVDKADRYHGASFGLGYSTPRFSLDGSYQYRTGSNVTGNISTLTDNKTDITQQTVMVSIIYYY